MKKFNNNVELKIIKNADHSFQKAPLYEQERIKQCMPLKSLKNTYDEEYLNTVIHFLRRGNNVIEA